MKRLLLTISVSLSLQVVLAQGGDAGPLLQQMTNALRKMESAVLVADYTDFNSGRADSLTQMEIRCVLQRAETDSIFGFHFALEQKGTTGHSEYIYDGIKAMDIWHVSETDDLSRTITVFNPHAFPNNFNNPAKARSTLDALTLPIFYELMSEDAYEKLIKNVQQMKLNERGDSWMVDISYQPRNGISIQRTIAIDKQTFLPVASQREVLWNGTVIRHRILFREFRKLESNDSLVLSYQKDLAGYAIRAFQEEKEAPAVSHLDIKVRNVAFPSFNGGQKLLLPSNYKLTLLDFWETWCSYCFLAMPQIEALKRKYESKGLNVLGLSSENRQQVEQILKRRPLEYENLYVDSSFIREMKISARPTYLLVDNSTGKVIAESFGDLQKIESLLSVLLR